MKFVCLYNAFFDLFVIYCFVCTLYTLIILIFLKLASMVFLTSIIHDEGPET